MKTLLIPVAVLAAFVFSVAASPKATKPKTSGVYLTADDYQNGRLSFEGDCRSKTHKLELHDVLHKSYIDVTHGTEKRRYAKSDLFGFRACNGKHYRFVSNEEYQILEAKELYVYMTETSVRVGKGLRSVPLYSFSVGASGKVLPLTLENLKQAFPDNHKFHDSLDATFGAGRPLAEYDKLHKMFRVNSLLAATDAPER